MIFDSPLHQIFCIFLQLNVNFSPLYECLLFFWCTCILFAVGGVLVLRVQNFQDIETVVTQGVPGMQKQHGVDFFG